MLWFQNLIFHLFYSASILLKSSEELYEEIVFHCAALMISKAANPITSIVLERVLATAIVQENIHVGYLALDIWTLYSRYSLRLRAAIAKRKCLNSVF